MSETNALLQKLGGVPTLTAGDQVLVNPLAATMAGNQAAQEVFKTRDWQAKQAAGQAYQQAIDPETGRFDPLKFNNLLAATGATGALAAKGGVESSQELQGAQLAQNAKMQSLLNDSVTAALASPDANLKQSVLEQAQRLRAAGFPSDRIDGSLLHLSSDPAQLRQQLETVRVGTLPPDQRQQVIYGTPSGVNQGGAYQPTMTDPRTGRTTQTGPGVMMTLSPAEQNETVNQPDLRKTLPDGTPNPNYGTEQPVTKKEQLEQMGFTVLPNGQVVKAGQPGQPGASPNLGPGRYPVPPALQGPGGAQPSGAQPPGTPEPAGQPGTNPNGKVPIPPPQRPISKASPADQEQMRAAGAKFDAEAAAGTNAQGQQAILANMLGDTKQFMPGPYANTLAAIRARLAPVFGADEKALAAHDSFEKLAAQLALQQAGSVGAGSDSRFSVTQAANPHGGISPASIDLILRQLQGNSDYIQARQKLAQQWPAKSDYNGFVDSTRPLDPRVFQYERMTDGQRKDWFTAMDPKDQKAFMQAHKWAEGNKLIPGG